MVQERTTGDIQAGPEATAAILPLVVGERIVCAAHAYEGKAVLCVRHGDEFIQRVFAPTSMAQRALMKEQGFYTNWLRYVSRTEAWKIAVSAQQIIRRVGGDSTNGGTLYSENLY